MADVFEGVAQPVATAGTRGAWLRRWRLLAIDGFDVDLPDSDVNVEAFGYAGSGANRSAYPKARVVALAECGTHAFLAARIGAWSQGEKTLAMGLYPRLRPDELLTADRNHARPLTHINRSDPLEGQLVLLIRNLLHLLHPCLLLLTGVPSPRWVARGSRSGTEILTGVLEATVRDPPGREPQRQTIVRAREPKKKPASAGNSTHFHACEASGTVRVTVVTSLLRQQA
jgi:hypothetical protein